MRLVCAVLLVSAVASADTKLTFVAPAKRPVKLVMTVHAQAGLLYEVRLDDLPIFRVDAATKKYPDGSSAEMCALEMSWLRHGLNHVDVKLLPGSETRLSKPLEPAVEVEMRWAAELETDDSYDDLWTWSIARAETSRATFDFPDPTWPIGLLWKDAEHLEALSARDAQQLTALLEQRSEALLHGRCAAWRRYYAFDFAAADQIGPEARKQLADGIAETCHKKGRPEPPGHFQLAAPLAFELVGEGHVAVGRAPAKDGTQRVTWAVRKHGVWISIPEGR